MEKKPEIFINLVANLIKNKQHLTRQGLNEIKELKTTMNKYSGGTSAD